MSEAIKLLESTLDELDADRDNYGYLCEKIESYLSGHAQEPIIKLINRLRDAEKERDELKARIDGGLRVKYWIDKECIHNTRRVIFNHAEQNATLILDDGVEL